MAHRPIASDRRPGALPEIRATGEGVTFEFGVQEAETGTRLRIRCDGSGELWIAIAGKHESAKSQGR